MMTFEVKHFDELTKLELFEIYKTRVEVFVVEQKCFYNDVDDFDLYAWHVIGKVNGEITAYGRVLPPQDGKYAKFGRVLITPEWRGKGYGKQLTRLLIDTCQKEYAQHSIKISSQGHLDGYYALFGFQTAGTRYLDAGIPHIDMILTP